LSAAGLDFSLKSALTGGKINNIHGIPPKEEKTVQGKNSVRGGKRVPGPKAEATP
jgi:hypothetical protein